MTVDHCPVAGTPTDLTGYHEVWDAFRQRELRQALYDAGGVVMADCLLDLHGSAHQARRRLENRLFRRGTFRWWEAEVVPGLIEEAMAPYVAAGRGDLIELGYRITMNLTAQVAGVDRPLGTAEETEALLGFTVKFSEGAVLVHSTRDHDEVNAEVAEVLEHFSEVFLAPSIARRQALLAQLEDGEIEEADLPRDVLTALLRNVDALELTPEVIRREVVFYLQAGSHSTANAFAHSVDEIFTWCEEHPDELDRLDDDVFLQRCVHEAFRMHPASPVAWRRALTDITLRDGRVIPAGASVNMDLRAANRDSEVFGANAAKFDPDRVVPDGVQPWGHTFGGGMHACIGMELDGGTVPRPEASADHVLGTVPLMVRALLDNNARRDPQHPPTRDPNTEREHFGTYPVLLGSAQ